MLHTARQVTIADSVIYTDLDGEVVLLDSLSGTYFGLDGVGARIWTLLCGGADADAIVERLLEEYEVAPELLRSDLDGFLDDLAARGVVTIEGD